MTTLGVSDEAAVTLAQEIEDELMKYTEECEYLLETNLVMDEVQTNSDVEVKITDCTKSLGNEFVAQEIEDELMKYTEECEHHVEANLVMDEVQTKSDVEVNITDCTKSLDNEFVAANFQEIAETSSSFDGSNSGFENVYTFGDSEASSNFRGDVASALDFDGSGEMFWMRRKKLTTHWRSFIHPLMWRCKWVELQIKNLQSKSQLYDRELEAYNEKRRTQLLNSTMINGMKSLPFSLKNSKTDVFKRKRRRMTEATVDAAAYMSHHNLFSCFENRRCFTGGAFMNYELENPGNQNIAIDHEILGNDELLSLKLGDSNDSFRKTLSKIDLLRSQVGKLKSKVDSMTREYGERISFAWNLNLIPPHSESGSEGAHIVSQSTGVLLPQAGETSNADVPITSGSIDPSCFKAHKKVIKKEKNIYEEVKIQQMPSSLKDGSGNTTPPVKPEPGLLADELPPEKVRSFATVTGSRNRKMTWKRSAATGRWC